MHHPSTYGIQQLVRWLPQSFPQESTGVTIKPRLKRIIYREFLAAADCFEQSTNCTGLVKKEKEEEEEEKERQIKSCQCHSTLA